MLTLMIALISLFTLVNACRKEIKSISDSDKPEITSKAKKDPNGKYAGPCPYDCDDSRCAYYSEPNPGCGSTGGGGGSTPLEKLNEVSQLHNDYQEYLLNYIYSLNVDLRDTNNLRRIINTKSSQFFQDRGYTYNQTVESYFTSGTVGFTFNSNDYSTQGASILSNLNSLLTNYNGSNDSYFLTSLESLKQQALNLSTETEIYKVGIPVNIAIYSYEYWIADGKGDYWVDLFVAQDSFRSGQSFERSYRSSWTTETSYYNKPINPGKVLAMDVAGAVRGATIGSLGGPGGALSGGVMGAATSSLFNLSGQVIGHLTGWW